MSPLPYAYGSKLQPDAGYVDLITVNCPTGAMIDKKNATAGALIDQPYGTWFWISVNDKFCTASRFCYVLPGTSPIKYCFNSPI
ncbi:hypothetical protein M378DRAFT_168375 [Amanita muscaria Koide BX008]|uniref:Uncharacterized protein n=1 Tax=Amanita muscaria (strain Koide BX008) TaxID=946122 RepID=A0A0C2T1A4_AMAMK|nr:hypothetical protein M378DRAFT_168375 [Amanita muscaria Koide BX008]